MAKPHRSVIALARFSLSEQDVLEAIKTLKSVTDWSKWLNQIELHGLSGFANQHIQNYDLQVPDDTRMSLRALSIRHRSAAKARYECLCQINQIFKDNGIPYLALKGAALMPMLYQQEALRPMRDMDLLIPRETEMQATQCMRDIGFNMPDEQPSKFMKNMHQLPDATKIINGFSISVELHRDAYNRDSVGSLSYPHLDKIQKVAWKDLTYNAFEDLTMIHQVSRHLESIHPNGFLKLINVMDVIGLAKHIDETGQWQQMNKQFPHVINTLRCLHLYTPLPKELQLQVTGLPTREIGGVGESMESLRSSILSKHTPINQRLIRLFSAPQWWLHLYYNVDPNKSLFWVKTVRHPVRVLNWLLRRINSRVLGG